MPQIPAWRSERPYRPHRLPFCLFGGPAPGLEGWLALLFLGLFQLGLSYVFYNRAIGHVTALEAILVPIIEPLLNPVWVYLRLGERPGRWAIIGGAVVITTITLRMVLAERKTGETGHRGRQTGSPA